MAKIKIPPVLRPSVGGEKEVQAGGGDVGSVLRSLAEEAGLRDSEEFARSFHILMKGSIVQAAEGDADAAKRAQQMARDLIERYR